MRTIQFLKEGQEPVESFMHDGLTDAFHYVPMGVTAENIAEKYDITREMQDEFANHSQAKAAKATQDGKFNNEIIGMTDAEGEQMTSDEGVRPNSSVEKLATLKTIFKEDGTVTGGNASSINDGSSALILMEESYAKAHGYDILGIVGDYAEVGCDPQYMGYAPFYAVEKLLDKTDSKIDDVDIVEMTEAFAAQSIPVKDNLHIPDEKLNIYGGAIALGHPIGASGARLVTTLVNALEQENKRTGIATACIGGGLGIALMIDKGNNGMKSLDKTFRHLSREDKLKQLVDYGWLTDESYDVLLKIHLINEEVANSLIENVIGQGTLPVGLLPKIIVDDKEYVVPMMVEEPSVVAAASYGAKLVNNTGGFKTVKSERLMIGQIVFDDVSDTDALAQAIYDLEPQIKQIAAEAYHQL